MGQQVNDPAASAAEGQLKGAIAVVEAIFGLDPEGRNVDIVTAVLVAIRVDYANESQPRFRRARVEAPSTARPAGRSA